jgi:hypothetical protein
MRLNISKAGFKMKLSKSLFLLIVVIAVFAAWGSFGLAI